MTRRFDCAAVAFTLVLGVLPAAAFAGEHSARSVPLLPKYQSECAACHVAYPPGLLPAQSWARIMSDLPHHFGTDASLDPASVTEISGWLAANAGTSRRTAGAGDRITTSPWFVREHREVPAATWRLPAVNKPSNCAACHRGADQGVFNEHDVRIPR
jgi:hypothetical protein